MTVNFHVAKLYFFSLYCLFIFQRKLQRCIKHIQDRHGIVLDNDPIDEMSYENPQVIADPDMSCPPVYVPLDESTQDSSNNGESNDSQMSDATGSDMTPPDKKLSDPLSAEALSVDGIPHEDELFFLSKAEIRCVVDQCALLGPHYHCQRCPYVTRQVSYVAFHGFLRSL